MEKVCCPRCGHISAVFIESYFCGNCHWPLVEKVFVHTDGSTDHLQVGDYDCETNAYWAGAQWVERHTLLALGVLPPWEQRVMLTSGG